MQCKTNLSQFQSTLLEHYSKGMNGYASAQQKDMVHQCSHETGLSNQQITNWIGNHRRKLKGKTAVRAEKRFAERQTSGKDIFYGERLPESKERKEKRTRAAEIDEVGTRKSQRLTAEPEKTEQHKKRGQRQQGKKGKKLAANSTEVVKCYGCGIAEKSDKDIKLGQDWIKCCKDGCGNWCHESCCEKGGQIDDFLFICSNCA